ncbi:uncharacterized protein FOMMEDRAFT_151371 [Fomitiporia mediterranea MF3/22]|uniref:uncharacterized protein n=1 Tax=Fomitiporia mediterranea (strain MF3/22) TaxID=694068 RepID=UPI0004409465|nr:uncharacterized protein FOMMEDRAFT_151371 [Fomitiporia mediterranea MF3/22]EJD08508.1 hypothetical protein FOMMEDRAFT_151371 [Fomitiporia mediterranea MF3/22]
MHALLHRIICLSVFSLLLTPIRSQPQELIVPATDSRIQYVGTGWTVQENGGHTFTSVPGSFSFNFAGTNVSWFSRKLYNGAIISIALDNDSITMDLSSGMNQNDTPAVAVLFEKDGLDGDESHLLNVTWEGPGSNGVGSFLENYQIKCVFSQFFPDASSSSPMDSFVPGNTSQPPVPSSTVVFSKQSHTNVGAIVGGVVGGVVGCVVLFGLAFFWLRRRRASVAAQRESNSATPFMAHLTPTPNPPTSSSYSQTSTKQRLDSSYSATPLSQSQGTPPTTNSAITRLRGLVGRSPLGGGGGVSQNSDSLPSDSNEQRGVDDAPPPAYT